ncbi:MAG: hypothetical protein ONB11_12335 [candidate division KSB1 bacterium]|nr:hypothetical protein [candidate division KSB1 bacterium]MDZ7341820.1 hypothetical protein [candidate division KSB1 bacterium]
MKKSRWLLMICLLPLLSFGQEECTVAVISGRATADGRPLLWKNRDTSFLDNEVGYFADGRYSYIGIINAGDRTQVWMGVNSAGFAIMNSESQDLEGDTLDAEGYFMKQALMECATAADFEQLLESTNITGRETKANFGVIDATGAAIIFETGNHNFAKFDANDPKTAPLGFIVRANFAMTAVDTSKSYGQIRYRRANQLLQPLAQQKNISYQSILRFIARDLANEKTDPYPLPFAGQEGNHPPGFLRTYHSINRFRTASCAVFHGVLPNENPLLTTMWVILGEPICGVAVPLWVAAGTTPAMTDGDATALLNQTIQELEARVYPDTSRKQYLATSLLLNHRNRGLLPELFKLEDHIFRTTDQRMRQWRRQFPTPEAMAKFETTLVNKTTFRLQKLQKQSK